MLVTFFLGGILLFLIYCLIKFWILDPWSIQKDLRDQGIPGEYIPIFGELLGHRRSFLDDDPFLYSREMAAKFGDYYHGSFGPKACLVTSDPSIIEGVLKTNARYYHKSTIAREILSSLLGYENILLAEDDKHSRHRRLIGPVFQHQNLNSMISLMIERTSRFLSKWKENIKNKDEPLTIDIHEEMTNLTLDIVTGCVFGTEIIKDENIHETIFQGVTTAVKEMEKRILNMIAFIPLINRLPLPGKRRIDQSRRDIKHVVQNIINQRKKGITKSACKGPDLLDLILTAHGDDKTGKFTDEEVSDQALTFVLAGHETTSTLMTWTLYNLANNPDVYHQCQAEIDSVLNDNNDDDDDDEITPSTISLLTYTEAVLKESLRYHQPVPILLRTAIQDNILIAKDGKRIRIKKGTDIRMNMHILHRSEKYWHEPNKFDPSRFTERCLDTSLPFGIGPHSCIGQNFAMLEAKIMLALILRRFHFELVFKQKNHVFCKLITIKIK